MTNNFIRCFRLISQLPPLQKAAILPHIYDMQRCALPVMWLMCIHHPTCRQALQTMCAAYGNKYGKFPIEYVAVVYVDKI